jgi:hypothetical protein
MRGPRISEAARGNFAQYSDFLENPLAPLHEL